MSPHRTLRLTTVLTVIAAMMAALLSVFATQASAAVANPDLAPACGTKVILVLDESGSIGTTPGAETNVRAAANAFAAGLADTGSQLAVIEFGSAAKRVFGYTDVTSGAGGSLATTFQPYFNGTAATGDRYDAPSQLGQWTNWQDALEEVRLLNTASGVAPLVVFVTDGDPTAVNTATGVQTNVSSATALAPAVVEADLVKGQGSHILAVGVGAALANTTSLNRLTQISGPDTVTTPAALSLATTDVLAISDFNNLPAALRQLVNELCKSSVTLTKLVDNGQGYVPGGAGWEFTGNVSTAAGSYTWLTPSAGPAGTRTASTAAVDSSVTFQWKPSVSTTSTITLAETQKVGYQIQSVACQVKSLANPTFVPLPVTLTGASFTANLGPTDIVACDVKNKKMNPNVTITKSVNPTVVLAGATVTYTIAVTNTGDVALNTVTVSDDTTPSCARVIGNLAVGQTSEFTCTAVINVDTTNVASVNAKDPQGTSLPPKSDTASVDVIAPALSITKTVNPSVVLAGTTVTYTITVTNSGDAPVSAITVADSITPACSQPVGALAPGASAQFTCQAVINEAVTNVATASGTDQLGNTVTSPQATARVDVIAPGLSITKSTDTPVVLPNSTVTWTIQVTNTGDVELTNVVVGDELAPDCNRVIPSLAANTAAAPIVCTSVVSDDTTNVATVTAIDPLENTVGPASASAFVDVIRPSFSVTKSVNPPVVLAGTTVTWTVVVTNTGDVPLSNIIVTDPQAPACDRVVAGLAVSGVETITCTAVINVDTLNVATVTADYATTQQPTIVEPGRAEPAPGFARLDPQSASASVDVIAPNLTLTKQVSQAQVASGANVVFTLTLTNTGDGSISNIVLSDPLAPGCSTPIGTLLQGASVTVTCTQAIAQTMTNVATATGTDPLGNTVTRQASVGVTVVPGGVVTGAEPTTIAIDKRGPATAKAGQVITYRIKITNTGTVAAENVVLRDKIPAGMALAAKPAGVRLVKGQVVITIGTLAPGQSKTTLLKFRIDRNVSGTRTNVATASASNAPTVRDTARTRIVRVQGVVRVPIVTG